MMQKTLLWVPCLTSGVVKWDCCIKQQSNLHKTTIKLTQRSMSHWLFGDSAWGTEPEQLSTGVIGLI